MLSFVIFVFVKQCSIYNLVSSENVSLCNVKSHEMILKECIEVCHKTNKIIQSALFGLTHRLGLIVPKGDKQNTNKKYTFILILRFPFCFPPCFALFKNSMSIFLSVCSPTSAVSSLLFVMSICSCLFQYTVYVQLLLYFKVFILVYSFVSVIMTVCSLVILSILIILIK